MPLPVVVIPAFPPRSPIPKVVGILAIVFAGLGLVTSLTLTLGFEKEFRRFGITKHDLGSFGTWMNVTMLPALAVFALHLTGGIMSLKYMPRSRTVTRASLPAPAPTK